MQPRFLIPAAILVAALQIGFLLFMIQGRAAILRDGAEVMLKVEPVDPRDLLRGDYVSLGYEISNVSKSLFPAGSGDAFSREAPVHIRLARGEDGLWRPVSAAFETPDRPPAEDEVDISGTVASGWQETADTVRIAYGIERFYLPEGEGRQIEQDMRERSFSMLVAVGGGGAAQIKAFYDGETRLYEEPLY